MSGDRSESVIKLGLIGAGRWGKNYIKTIQRVENAQLCWLASQNSADAWLAPAGCQFTTQWRDMLSDRHLNGIIIATPPALHAEMAYAAVKVGLGVMIEKPLSLNLEEALSLYDVVAQYKGCVFVDHTYLFHPAYRKLKEIVPDRDRLVKVRSVGGNWGPFRSGFPVLWDWGAHDVAMCLDFFGQYPASIEAQCIEANEIDGEEGGLYSMRLTFDDRGWADITVGNLMKEKTRLFEVHFENAVLVMDDTADEKSKLKFRHSDKLSEESSIPVESELPLDCVVREFSTALRSHSDNFDSLWLGVNVVKILTQVQKEMKKSKLQKKSAYEY